MRRQILEFRKRCVSEILVLRIACRDRRPIMKVANPDTELGTRLERLNALPVYAKNQFTTIQTARTIR
jgi:hypothetical protein